MPTLTTRADGRRAISAAIVLCAFLTVGEVAGTPVPGTPPPAIPPGTGESFFLSSSTRWNEGHVPLAIVRRGDVVDAVARHASPSARRTHGCGPRARWAAIGSRWHALDEWGQIVSTRTVSRREIYDVTGCAELTLSPASKGDDLAILVSVDSSWHPSPSPAWLPDGAAQTSFRALADTTIDDRRAGRRARHRECDPMKRRVAFFTSATGERYGVATSDIGYLVARLDGESWTPVLSRSEPGKHPPSFTCYRPIAIFDMNQDGSPEIVLFQSTGESWGDLVLGRGRDGNWTVVAISPGSAIV